MSLSGKIPHVFSGEDDQPVILSLPLAFLRLIASGVYTYDIDWRDQDWEADQPTSEQLAIIEGALTAVTVAADGVSLECEKMQSVGQEVVEILSVTVSDPGSVFTVDYDDLPEEAGSASALLLGIAIYMQDGGGFSVYDDDNALQYFDIDSGVSSYLQLSIVAPINSGIVRFSLEPNSGQRSMSVRLIGWWK